MKTLNAPPCASAGNQVSARAAAAPEDFKNVIPTKRSAWRELSTKLKQYYTYILRNKSGNFYIGVTNNLARRTREHKQKYAAGFAEKYNIDILVYYEIYNDPMSAIMREKQLKNWSRKKKIMLIIKMNPKFSELDPSTSLGMTDTINVCPN